VEVRSGHPITRTGTSARSDADGATARDGVENPAAVRAQTERGKVVDAQGYGVARESVRAGLGNASWIGEGPRQVFTDDSRRVHRARLERQAAVATSRSPPAEAATESVKVGRRERRPVNKRRVKLDVTGTIAGVVVRRRRRADRRGAGLGVPRISARKAAREAGGGTLSHGGCAASRSIPAPVTASSR